MPELDLVPVWISLKTASLSTIITFFLGCAAARWLVSYQGKAKGLIDGLFTLPLVLPPTVLGFGLLLLFGKHGPLGKLLLKMGTTVIFSWWATVIASTVVAFPLMYQTTRGSFEQIEPNIENAARTLGASEWNIFWRVTVPLAWPGIMAGIILSFARSLGEFGATLMIAGNIPGKTQTIPLAIYFAVAAGNNTKALVWVAIILVISMASIFSLNYWKRLNLQAYSKR
ncbi:MAG TPA: molybdate ABC transporter permease subunit [Firmicutes bacterium]|nr:molybdate ABC transporter permease subunit [Bacillota bacterium]